MATSLQGKKKKKVLSQQEIQKLLGMLKEEDKPLRAGILAKTLGYQSAKDINPTLLRLEGYGRVSRVTMNNTPLWKYCSRDGGMPTAAAVMALSPAGSLTGGEGLRMMGQENGSMHSNSIDDCRPSRPQSTKADLEWDPTDIQAHRDEDDPGMLLENHATVTSAPCIEVSKSDYHQMMSYSSTVASTNYISPAHHEVMVAATNAGLTVSSANFTDGNLSPGSSLVFTTPTYPNQGLYNTIDTRPDQVNMHMNMNGLDPKVSNGKDYMSQGEYTSIHAGYGGSGGGGGNAGGGGMTMSDMNGGHNLTITSAGMQGNFSMDYSHHVNHDPDMSHEGDMYMPSNGVRHLSNGVNPNSVQSGLQNFPLTHNQPPPQEFQPRNNFNSSISNMGLSHKSAVSSGQGYGRGSHSHYSQSNYTPSNGTNRNSQVMPTYVVQEIIKAETVGQYGMTAAPPPQGPPPPPQAPPPPQETRSLGGYQSMHHHPGLDPSAGVMPFSQQQFHPNTSASLNNNQSTQPPHPHHPHHHHHQHHHHTTQQQQQQQMQTQQHHLHHHHHHHPAPPHHQQQQPMTQAAANYVNMGTFPPSGPFSQYQSTFSLGAAPPASNRTYSGQQQGGAAATTANYSCGNLNSKDFAKYSGISPGYRGNTQAAAAKRHQQHFNGFTPAGVTPTGVFHNQIRNQVALNKANQGQGQGRHQQSYSNKQSYNNQQDRHRNHHGNRSKNGIGHGQRHTNNNSNHHIHHHHHLNHHQHHNHYDEGKSRQRCNSGEKDQGKNSENSKYLGTEVLDDICRRLAKQANMNLKNHSQQTPTSEKSQAKPEQLKKENVESQQTQQQKPQPTAKTETAVVSNLKEQDKTTTTTDKDQLNNNENKLKSPEGIKNNNNNKVEQQGQQEKLNNREQQNALSRTQNHSRNYNHNGRYPHNPYRGAQYIRDNSRYGHNINNYRPPGRDSKSNSNKKVAENHQGKAGSVTSSNNHSLKRSSATASPTEGSKREAEVHREEKEVEIKGNEVNIHRLEKCESAEAISDERPLVRYKAILADHLDPNNVLLSHLFVKGLIDQVLVDRVRRMKTRRDAMERLLPGLLHITEEAITGALCDALQKSGQGHLAELLKGTGLGSKESMSEKHMAYLEQHRQNIAASMIPDKDLLTYLRTDSVLTADLHRFITSQPSRAQQIDTLLQVLPFRGAKAFEVFRTALRRSGQPWLAEQIAMDLT